MHIQKAHRLQLPPQGLLQMKAPTACYSAQHGEASKSVMLESVQYVYEVRGCDCLEND